MIPFMISHKEQAPITPNKLILSHGTAKAYYLTLDPAHEKAASKCEENPLAQAGATADLLELVNTNYSGFGNKDTEVLVPNVRLRRQRSGLITHCSRFEYPPGSFWKLRRSVYLASPELCFLQMAAELEEARLIEFGINLCAKYYLHPSTGEIMERKPVTTAEQLRQYVEKVGTTHRGAKVARNALRWVVDNTASPMETRCAIMMHCPKRLGACGFPLVTANYEVKPGKYRSLTEQGFFVIDGAWPEALVGYEYLGSDEHPDLARDMRRIDALTALGWRIVTIDKRVFYSPERFEVAARQIACNLGIRFRMPNDWRARNLMLRHELGFLDSSRDSSQYFKLY